VEGASPLGEPTQPGLHSPEHQVLKRVLPQVMGQEPPGKMTGGMPAQTVSTKRKYTNSCRHSIKFVRRTEAAVWELCLHC